MVISQLYFLSEALKMTLYRSDTEPRTSGSGDCLYLVVSTKPFCTTWVQD